MDVELLKKDVLGGAISVDRLIDLVVTSQRELQAAKRRIAELERQLGGSTSQKVAEPFSVRAEELRQKKRGRHRRRPNSRRKGGRKTTVEKVARAAHREKVFPADVAETDCRLSHTRPVWRLKDGRAVLVAYEIYRGPNNRFGKIPGVLGRSEFGIEIVLAIAYQVYVVGLSFDKVCLLMNFFEDLKLRKSQAEALVKQLARAWEEEFDVLCGLLAGSLVVQTDETGWSIRSVWAFLSEKVRVVLFGVHKDAATLAELLDPATFPGIVISDDAAVYANFTRAQKCWAHLLHKAIKLTLQEPTNADFRWFADRLLEIYRDACRAQRDKRLGPEGRRRKAFVLRNRLSELCGDVWASEWPPSKGPLGDYRRLCEEIMRLLLADELFTFVTARPLQQPNGETMVVPGTNNESERTLRSAAQARVTGRTSKTVAGARRRTVIVSVLESLRMHLSTFTLSSVIEEVGHWFEVGRSCFRRLAEKLGLPPSDSRHEDGRSLLDRILPDPGG
jgi:transposase